MAGTPRLDKFLFTGGLWILALAALGAVMAFNAPCIDVGCIIAGAKLYAAAGAAALGGVLAVIGGIRIKLRKARLKSEKSQSK